MTHTARTHRLPLLVLSCVLIVILSACDLPWSSTPTQAVSNHIDNPADTSAFPTPTPATKPVPPTKTSCPASGTARALVTAPLAAGQNQAIIYIVNQANSATQPILSMVKSYNVKTGKKKTLVQLANQFISWGHLSPDGQWFLYGISQTNIYQVTTLQAVRVDGQGRQTLYCNPNGIGIAQWSPDQKKIAFQANQFQVLDPATGKLQTAFSYDAIGAGDSIAFNSRLDSQHLYFHEIGHAGGTGDVYVLDLAKGANQTINDLTRIHSNGYRTSLVASYDRTQIYATYNGCDQIGCKPPSSIMALPALGGTTHTLWQSAQYAAVYTCPITAQQMLVTIQNAYQGADVSHNGTWLMNNDGSGMKLVSGSANNTGYAILNICTYPWDIVSRDSSLYAASSGYGLLYSKLDGSNSPVTFATGSPTLQTNIAGWTLL